MVAHPTVSDNKTTQNQHLRSLKTRIKATKRISSGRKLAELCPELAKIFKINLKNANKTHAIGLTPCGCAGRYKPF